MPLQRRRPRAGLILRRYFGTENAVSRRSGWSPRNNEAASPFIQALSNATKSKSLAEGRRLHTELTKKGLDHDPEIQNQLVQMYSVCGSLDEARKIFDSMPGLPRPITWNMLIGGYSKAGKMNEARDLFNKMPGKNVASWTTMVTMYARAGQKEEAKSMFDRMEYPGAIAYSAMIGLYAHSGQIDEGKSMYDSMPERTVQCHNVMITGFGYNGRVAEAKSSQNGHVEEAQDLFQQMPEKSIISWNTMIAGLTQNGFPSKALELFKHMDLEGMQPNKWTYCSVLDACANLTATSEGKLIHVGIAADPALARDMNVANALCNMYGKCGLPELARQIFIGMTYPDVVSWTSLITAYSQNGYSAEALEVFRIMLQVGETPNRVTFINTLSACSHGGLYEDGCDIFSCLTRDDFHVTPEEAHFLCVVDLLGRSGQLEAAEMLITKMDFKASAVAWTSLLSACRTYRDMNRAARVAQRLFELDASPTKDPAPYVMLCNIYASAGHRAEEMKIRDEIKFKCRKKQPGKSIITIRGQANEFYSLDESHPKRDEAYTELRRLFEEMKDAGYVPDCRRAEMEDEETEQSASYHSEKLALAYGVIHTSAGAPLSIIKNLRVCSDCHSVIKFLSKMLGRKIAVRDSTRFHHFDNGFCSCRDYLHSSNVVHNPSCRFSSTMLLEVHASVEVDGHTVLQPIWKFCSANREQPSLT